MCSPKIFITALALAIVHVATCESAMAKGIVIGIGAAGDTADGRAYSLFADQGRVNSLGVGFLTPIGSAADIEFRLAFDESDDFGSATVLSVFLFLYAG
jgi:hypothetical protein